MNAILCKTIQTILLTALVAIHFKILRVLVIVFIMLECFTIYQLLYFIGFVHVKNFLSKILSLKSYS